MIEKIPPFLGQSPSLLAVREAIAKVATTDATVLIHGETGTGKELIAQAIHQSSHRSARSFVPVNCVAFAPSLVASELFGHEAGAFTGAIKRRIGRFEQASHGTLFLDEISEMPLDIQSMLLRVLQERVIERVGGDAIPVDVRIIAATNRDLAEAVRLERFRNDFFYRINVFPIAVPPLRERRSDIPELANYFMEYFADRYQRAVRRIPPSTLQFLKNHDWPGNIRELRNIIERAMIVSSGPDLEIEPAWLVGASVVESAKTWSAQERQRILDALRATQGRVYGPGGAAHRLGLKPTTLYGKMKKHNTHRTETDWE